MLTSDGSRPGVFAGTDAQTPTPPRHFEDGLPEMLGETSRLLDGPWRFGYSSEFTAYAEYAQSHPESYSG